MPRRGRRPAATDAQVEEVRRLAGEGASRREIATIVFGDPRYRGRVDRILRKSEGPTTLEPTPRNHLPSGDASDTRRWLREMLDRHRERLAGEELPSLQEIKLVMELERRLEAVETVEQANALTRELHS